MDDQRKRKIFFEKIKEAREGYFVEYSPPGGEVRFASLTLVFHEGTTSEDAKGRMEAEAKIWVSRYPVPVMVFACDEKGDTVEVGESWRNNNLIAWRQSNGQLEKRWELVENEELPDDALAINYLLKVYEGLPNRTLEEVREQANAKWTQRSKELRFGFAIIFIWAVIVPIGIAVLGWANPAVGLIVTLYALGKAARQGGLMLGWFKLSEREQEKREKEQRMRHYYYHCERNPKGFRRMVSETLEQDERIEIEHEARELRR